MNLALDGESPYDNANLYGFLIKHIAVVESSSRMKYSAYTQRNSGLNENTDNANFYTTDGMRFEFNIEGGTGAGHDRLHESGVYACDETKPPRNICGGCGSYGLNHNPNNTTKRPCIILVDVNGDKKPTPGNVNCQSATTCGRSSNVYKVPQPGEKKVRDIFSILITEDRAIPYGVTAQKAMYQAQK